PGGGPSRAGPATTTTHPATRAGPAPATNSRTASAHRRLTNPGARHTAITPGATNVAAGVRPTPAIPATTSAPSRDLLTFRDSADQKAAASANTSGTSTERKSTFPCQILARFRLPQDA